MSQPIPTLAAPALVFGLAAGLAACVQGSDRANVPGFIPGPSPSPPVHNETFVPMQPVAMQAPPFPGGPIARPDGPACQDQSDCVSGICPCGGPLCQQFECLSNHKCTQIAASLAAANPEGAVCMDAVCRFQDALPLGDFPCSQDVEEDAGR